MSEAAVRQGGVTAAHARRLFIGSCVALTSGSMMFAIVSDILGPLKQEFVLSNEQIGWMRSGGAWGFMLSMFLLGPLCDALGMRRLLRLALVCHAAGIAMMIAANGFWMLFFGGLVNSIGSGAVEAACNPLVATIYPDKKTHKLSQFHMWFPGGIVIGGVACYLMSQAGLGNWQWKLTLALVPTAMYGIMFTGQYFPPTERVQAGVTFGGMFKETFLRPLFLVLLGCMVLTASLELGPMGWIPSVLEAGGVPGILVLVWITGLMAVLRLFCGPVVKVLTNTGLLLLSAAVAGLGLLLLSFSANIYMVGAAATLFAFGVCYFWPTMIGTAAERVPKGGALALSVLGGTGSLFVGIVTTPLMGWIADGQLHRELVFQGVVEGRQVDRRQDTVAAFREIDAAYGKWAAGLGETKRDELTKRQVGQVHDTARAVLASWQSSGSLPETATANALRMAISNGPPGPADKVAGPAEAEALAAKKKAQAILNPAENKGGLLSFRWVSVVAVVLIVVFGVMFVQDRRRARMMASVTGQP